MSYKYDQTRNTIAKGNSYSFTGGKGYWEYDYNARNRLMEVWKNGEEETQNISRYWYDHNGKRIKVEEAGKVVYHIFNYLGQEIYEDNLTANEQTLYVYALGKLIGKKDMHVGADEGGSPVEVEDKYYYHQDNLGSTVMMTDESGQVVFEQDYTPFGQTFYQSGTVKKPTSGVEPGFGYTGQREEVDIGLYYYNARYYDLEIGRFTREDEYQGDITRSQTLNLYSYVLQNPLKYVDPDGYMANFSSNESGAITSEEEYLEHIRYMTSQPKYEEMKPNENAVLAGFIVGGVNAGINTVSDLYSTVTHPVKTVKNTWNGIVTLVRKRQIAVDAVVNYYNTFVEANPYEKSKMLGDVGGQILIDVLAGQVALKVANKASDISKSLIIATKVTENVSDVANTPMLRMNLQLFSTKRDDFFEGMSNLKYVLKNTDIDLRGTGIAFDDALDMAFKNTGLNKTDFKVTKWGKNEYGKSFPIEWRAPNGAEVNIDFTHYNVDVNDNWITGPDAPYIGWQTGGKRSSEGAIRGHIIIDNVPYGR